MLNYLSFWVKAVLTITHFINKSSSLSINFKTPEELWNGKPKNYSKLKVFSSLVFTHISNGKLQPRAKRYIFVGYLEGVKGFRLGIYWVKSISIVRMACSLRVRLSNPLQIVN